MDDVGRSLSWRALRSFLSSAKPGSALNSELRPELAEWATVVKTNSILADIFDQLSLINSKLTVLITHKRGRRPEPYKRPGMEKQNQHHYGSGAMPIAELREWIKQRQKAG